MLTASILSTEERDVTTSVSRAPGLASMLSELSAETLIKGYAKKGSTLLRDMPSESSFRIE
jgi:hypothetical protein